MLVNEGKQVVNIGLSDDRLWKSIQYCLKCVTPLMKVLRLVDEDTKLAMPYIYIYIYIYEAMDKAKEQIASNFKNQDSQYKRCGK